MTSRISRVFLAGFDSFHIYFMFYVISLNFNYALSTSSLSTASTSNNKNGANRRSRNPNQVIDDSGHPHEIQGDQGMDSKFDFHFNWDEEPPEFISQLDLEVKWDDEEENEKTTKKVSIHNVTMNHDYDITGPMTKLITSIANTSFHEDRLNSLAVSSTTTTTPAPDVGNNSMKQNLKGDPAQKKEGKKGRGGRKRMKGEKGQKGAPGLSIVGPKGEPGDPGMLPYHLMRPDINRLKGEQGPRGPPGVPGTCSARCTNENLMPEPSSLQNPPMDRDPIPSPQKHHYRIVPGALVFKSKPTMYHMSTYVMVGSVVFVEDSDEFYGKVKDGWRKFQMGSLENQ